MTTEQRLAPARDWRDTFRDGADLALLGVVVSIACLPLVTAGGVVAVAAEAVAVRYGQGRWLTLGELWAALRRRFLPGLAAGAVVLITVALLLADQVLLAGGVVPGGTALAWVTGLLGLVILGIYALVVPFVGRGLGFWAAVGAARGVAVARPGVLVGVVGVLVLSGFLAWVLPVAGPLLVGYVLLALHGIVQRSTVAHS
ncbi:hypothetical protein F4553_003690 [Allocatelliglobosispora scoriae]|uniref:DUF624 domain-containing protein n=1 Tax=Allocatelliglobosispora scoriae TaxID=643052 RepID=A0A841BU72_9ACTN|nr:hypothetical protein [Allocatelliglobosispora scoriae]MBB5870311.1 hypothetical protein [Allocatelliglobosispora scoriae]